MVCARMMRVMNVHDTEAYQKAFIRYLRKGTPIALSLKAEEHPTTHYIWRTAGDGKVRAAHAANEGRIFAWDNPPPTGHPGEDFNCRCTAEPFYGHVINDPPIEPVYPIEGALLLLSGGEAILAVISLYPYTVS
jgi:SPP1 gp7 family putative phage head morphogenesis protein